MQATGGTGALNFLWSSPTVPAGTQASTTLCPGQYTVTVQDSKGCTDTSQFAIGAAAAITKTIRLINNQSRMARRAIPHCVVLTRTSAAVRSRTLKNVQEQLAENGIEVLRTGIVERAAFRELFDFGGTLSDLNPNQVSNLGNAIENAREFAGEVITKLKAIEGGP